MPLEGEVPRRLFEHAPVCDPEKEAREAEDKGSDEEDSGPDDDDDDGGKGDGEGEGDLVVLEAGGVEEETARAKSAAMAKTRRLSNVAGPEIKEKVRRLWDCVSFPSLPIPHCPFPLSNFPSPLPSPPFPLFSPHIPQVRVTPPVRAPSLTQQTHNSADAAAPN